MRPNKIYLYDEPKIPEIRIEDLAKFLKKETNIEVEVRDNFFKYFDLEKKSRQIASCKIMNPLVPFERHNPSMEEIMHETQSINTPRHDNITLYDGFELQRVLRESIPESESTKEKFHLLFTTKLTCTFDNDDYRYHGRAIICSNPSIISTTGIIEAPAKPREYYLQLYQNIAQGLNLNILKEAFKGRFLEDHDENIGIVVRGYAMQAAFYYLTGQPFCDTKECILFNAHWQEDLLYSQVKNGVLCSRHRDILKDVASFE